MKKKILILALLILSLFGCTLAETPARKVEDYLEKFKTLDDEVVDDMETTIINENLSNDNLNIYREVLTRQYQNFKYEIGEEIVNEKDASVEVNITVYDLLKSQNAATTYMNEHLDEFNDVNSTFDEEAFTKYKLGEMLKSNETVDYQITFYLNKVNGEWVLQNPNREVLEKLHGLYDYNID